MDFGNCVNGEFRQAYNGNLAWSGLGPPYNAPNPKRISTLGYYWVAKVATIADETNL